MPRRPASMSEPRVTLNRERVLRAAVELADTHGIESLKMRELGSVLGVEAMSLYNHVANKDDLLDGILELVVSDIELPESGTDWKQAMRRRALSAREVFTRHPWASALNDSRASAGPQRMRYFDWVIGTLRTAGFSVGLALRAFSAIDSYVYGFGRQAMGALDGPELADSAETLLAAIPADEFPYLLEATRHTIEHGYDERADFEFGLGLILDGLERARDAELSR